MRLLRRLAALVALLALTWAFAPGAAAGGPTSVLLSSPGSGEITALYYTDAEYEKLMALLGPAGTDGHTERPPSLDMAAGTRLINVTWMIHDVQPWRVDRVYPAERADAVWINTSTETGAKQDTWYRAGNPEELTGLLTKLGLMGAKSPSGGGGAGYSPAWEQDESVVEGSADGAITAAEESEQEPLPVAADPAVTTGWWWSVPGLAAGAALAVTLRPLARRLPRPLLGGPARPVDPGPRQQLLDD